jgi:pimeloyl-ACP methyl ester carboxylesterase
VPNLGRIQTGASGLALKLTSLWGGMERIILRNGPLSFTAHASGPADGPVVLLLHGFPDNPHTFGEQLRVLSSAGYRAIAPTLRGYESSSQPADGDYRIGTMARVHLVGHDWGAAVTYVAGALAPDRFHSLTTLAVPHLPRVRAALLMAPVQLLNSWYMRFFQLPWISDWAIERNDWAMLKWLSAIWSPGFSWSEAQWNNRRETFEAPGVKQAMLAHYRQNASLGVLLGLFPSEAFRLTKVPVRTLAISGVEDGCMDTRMYDKVFCEEDFPAGFRILKIESVGHFVHLEAPQAVNDALIEWLKLDGGPNHGGRTAEVQTLRGVDKLR